MARDILRLRILRGGVLITATRHLSIGLLLLLRHGLALLPGTDNNSKLAPPPGLWALLRDNAVILPAVAVLVSRVGLAHVLIALVVDGLVVAHPALAF